MTRKSVECTLVGAAVLLTAGPAVAAETVVFERGWLVLVVTTLTIILAVGIHYELLRLLTRLQPTLAGFVRGGLPLLVLGLIFAHVLEIMLFGVAYLLLDGVGELGRLAGAHPASFNDYVYFSAVVYSTLGFGDLIPVGPLRTMAGMEALTGLLLIGWSTSFTFLEMQRHWVSQRESRSRR
jgi:hypothetical protein